MSRNLMLPAQAVPLSTNMTVLDAAIAAYNGFPESDTQIMWVGGFIKERKRSASYPNIATKGAYLQRGVLLAVFPERRLYAQIAKNGTSIDNSSTARISSLLTHQLILYKITRSGTITEYKSGSVLSLATMAGFSAGEHWTDGTYGPQSLVASGNANISVCNLIFASTNNAADTDKITDEEILRFAKTGIPPAKAIHWPMNEGTGTVCKAYVNGVNVPELNGTLSSNSWTTDDNFGRI